MNEKRLVDEFLEMVKISSITRNEGSFASMLTSKLKEMGFEVYVDEAGKKVGGNTGNVIGKLKGTKNVAPILLCAHMDTVVPGENIQPVIKDGFIYSDGTTILGADDKAGIAAIFEALRHIKENHISHGDIEVAFTIGEEDGLLGAKAFDYANLQSKMAFVLDSGGDVGGVIVQGPAQKKLYVKIIGKAAHAGVAPELGINAIQVAARAIDKMKLLRIDHETTANIGIIKGGSATNIVCDQVDLVLEARSLDSQKLDAQVAHMIASINEACSDFSVTNEIVVENNYPSFLIDHNSDILKIVDGAMKKMDITMVPRSTGGGSDTNIFNSNGINAVTLAIGYNSVHTTKENISVSSLVNTARLVSELIQEAN